MDKAAKPWSVPVTVEQIPDAGLHMDIEAPEAARAQIAGLAGLRDLPALAAAFDLARVGAGLHVTGNVKAKVGQICVVSLEPIESEVMETVDLRFFPTAEITEAEPQRLRQRPKGDDEPPEPLIGGTIDLGALAVEFLVLGIDPYPRKPGVEFAPPKAEDGGEHPFAALETLKKQLGGGQS
jgi:hypothetical protein